VAGLHGAILDSWSNYINQVEKHVFIVTYGCYPDTTQSLSCPTSTKRSGCFVKTSVSGLDMPDGYKRSTNDLVRPQLRQRRTSRGDS